MLSDLNKTALLLAKQARESMGDYCITTCGAKCCKRGFLLLINDKEVKAIVGDKTKEYLKKEILIPGNSGYFYDSEKKNCKNLDQKTYLCSIHLDTSRPLVCRDYPIFILKNKVMFGKTCPYVIEGKFNNVIEEFKELGYDIL